MGRFLEGRSLQYRQLPNTSQQKVSKSIPAEMAGTTLKQISQLVAEVT
jgi:hypothetical protein